MQAQREAPDDMQCKDKFLVQSVVAGSVTAVKDITSEMVIPASSALILLRSGAGEISVRPLFCAVHQGIRELRGGVQAEGGLRASASAAVSCSRGIRGGVLSQGFAV